MSYWEKCPHGLPEINCSFCMSAKTRNNTIEECARVAQQWLIRAEQGSGEDLIDAICALKGKP